MSSSLASRQGILRRSINRLSSLLHDHTDLLTQRLGSGQEPGAEDRKVLLRAVKRAETAIHLERERLESALDIYTSTADNLDANVQMPSDTLEKVETNVEAAHELLDEALTALTTLTVLQQELESLDVTHSSETPDSSCISSMKLAPIPVPKFSGEIWEWETFWKSFEHSTAQSDSKNIDDIYKLNYLLDSLQGRVRESVKHFEVSGAAFPLVVAYLKNKYDDKEALIERLLHNLQYARAHTDRLEDQESLCEELESIVSQLKIKGEHVDNVFLQRQLISKFLSSSLASQQGILRRSINRLSSLLHDHTDLLTQRLGSGQEPGAEDRKVLLRAVKRAETAIHLERERLESALDKYTSTADNLDANVQMPSDTLEKVETNVEAAHELLDEALTALTTLTVLQQELESLDVTHSSETPDSSCISSMKLAPIPVPKFSGEIWEWETFWKSFEHSTAQSDSKNIDDIYKLNYLLDSLQGRVRESVKHFEVSGAAYPLVVAYLKNKYDDKEALIERLLHNLQYARAHTDRLEDQESLCEELESIVSQLKIKGEHVDNVFLQRQLISKFSPEVQKHVIRQKTKNEAEGSWNTLTLLLKAKEYIKGEIRVTRQMKQWTICDTSQETSSTPYGAQHRKTPTKSLLLLWKEWASASELQRSYFIERTTPNH
uniref:UVRC domain-containing protein n=1 Tax=Haemonchus contortus TaxID=6289 RepID=A0A7I4YKH5_HAECO